MTFKLTRREAVFAAGLAAVLPMGSAMAARLGASLPVVALFDGRYIDPATAAELWPAALDRLDVRADMARIWYDMLPDWRGYGAFRLSGVTTYADYLTAQGCSLEEHRRKGAGKLATTTIARLALDGRANRRFLRRASAPGITLYRWDIG